ncbi:MAG: hemolysin III family protein [Apibacter sp.]|nr:hemolysin III family protein [Apibacter sp.]
MAKTVRDKQELLNTISHGMGIVFGVVGLILLFIKNKSSSIYSTVSIWTFGISLIILYTSSTVYHFFVDENLKKKARVLDHMSIFLLIAGTYTPICLIVLEKSSGWTLFTIVWIIAALGIFMKIFLTGKVDKLSLLLYLVMGWLLVFDLKNIANSMTSESLLFLVLGGIFYTLGTIFYAKDKMPYAHFIWHLFVLGGSISHYVMVYYII